MISKHLYDNLPEEVKAIMKHHHAYYLEKYGKKHPQNKNKPRAASSRSINVLSSDHCPEDEHHEETLEAPNISHGGDPQEDPVMATFQQFLTNGRKVNLSTRVFNLPSQAINAHFARSRQYGRLISDNAADIGSLTPKFCHITHTSSQEVLVNGCHPQLTKSYRLVNGITAIDLPSGTVRVGQHDVPLIPESQIMLISETQARCCGVDIDSRSTTFGGRGSITIDDDLYIPLHLEQALMTCPIRMPTQDELETLQVPWLSADSLHCQ